MKIPENLLYTEEHEWILETGEGTVRIGITDYAQDQLGDIVFVELPDPGRAVAKGDVIAEIESTKSVGEVYAPFAASVAAVNAGAREKPELVNQDPYGEGWLVELTTNETLPEGLLDAAAYSGLVG